MGTICRVADEPTDLLLSRIEDMKGVIQSATSHLQVMEILDYASASAKLLKTRGGAKEHVNAVLEVKLIAERHLGSMLANMPKNRGGGDVRNHRSHDVTGDLPSLSDLGIGKMDSSRWQAIAGIDGDIFEQHVRETKEAGKELTTNAVLKLAKRLKAAEDCKPSEATLPAGPRVIANLQQAIERGQKFGTIYADPPWRYGNQGTRAATDDHYVTMSVAEICAEPVKELAADNAHLHLWTTNAFLFDAKDVMEAWGFTYKSCFIWIKPQMGIGNYWRVSHEFLLLGIRGNAPFGSRNGMSWDAHDEDSQSLCPECGQSLAYGERSWGSYDRGRHSAKPDEIRRKIEKVSPGPYLEMYGRILDPNGPWTVYGNQVQEKQFMQGLDVGTRPALVQDGLF